MKREELEKYLGKQCKLSLKNGSFYSCKIKGVGEDSISFTDKFGNECLASLDQIATIFEERQRW